jgi:hypothetical protein
MLLQLPRRQQALLPVRLGQHVRPAALLLLLRRLRYLDGTLLRMMCGSLLLCQGFC